MQFDDEESEDEEMRDEEITQRRSRLIKELSARLTRDQQLRYAEREFLLQRALMGKGARKKLAGPEKQEEDSDEEMDSKRRRADKSKVAGVGEVYKPRLYKWKQERKK